MDISHDHSGIQYRYFILVTFPWSYPLSPLYEQVLPNRTECGNAQNCNQPPAVFQKAVILLIGKALFHPLSICTNNFSDALKYDFCLHNDSLLSPKPYQVSLELVSNVPPEIKLFLSEQTTSAANLGETGSYIRTRSRKALQVRFSFGLVLHRFL